MRAAAASADWKGDVMAFVMRDGWKEEPQSITGAEYVEPSASALLKPGQRVAHLFPRSVMEEYVLQRVTDRVWWVGRHFYNALFYVGERRRRARRAAARRAAGVRRGDPQGGPGGHPPASHPDLLLALPRRPRRLRAQ